MMLVDPAERETEVLARLVSFDGLDVLDVGCGEGRTAHRLARSARSVVGVDPDADRIGRARATRPEDGSCPIRFLDESVVTLGFAEEQFDAVIFTRSL